jgi:hypothetical protein
MRLLPVVLALAACARPEPGPPPIFAPDSPALLGSIWPSDARRDADGSVDVSGFPDVESAPLLLRYLAYADAQEGYGTNSPMYVPFGAALDPDGLPSPAESRREESPLQLVVVDPNSPYWGERVPLRSAFYREVGTHRPPNLLAVAPVWGFPLHPRTQYALVLTTALVEPAAGFSAVWDPANPLHATYAPLADALPYLGLEAEDVAIASVFTTGDPTRAMASMARLIHDHMEPPAFSQTITRDPERGNEWHRYYEGTYQSPVFQHGERPYATSGGGLQFAENGAPIVHSWDNMRMSVCTPPDLSNPPPTGWPVVLLAHGTGGDFRSHCGSGNGIAIPSMLGKAGIIGIGIDQPLHGPRGTPTTNVDMHWFNYLNPESGTTNFLQAAIDTVYLARVLAHQQVTLTTDTGELIPLDPARIGYFGHSQGGISGAIALPFVGADLQAAMLSGAGGGLSITILERKDPLDIAAQIEGLLGFPEGDHLDDLHPVTGLVQWITDRTDPINYAPHWFAVDDRLPGGAPMHVLVSSGELDAATPYRSTSAMAVAARLPMVGPAFDPPEGLDLADLPVLGFPSREGATAWDGSTRTAGLTQWAGEDHWVVLDEAEPALMVGGFLEGVATGEPVIATR